MLVIIKLCYTILIFGIETDSTNQQDVSFLFMTSLRGRFLYSMVWYKLFFLLFGDLTGRFETTFLEPILWNLMQLHFSNISI